MPPRRRNQEAPHFDPDDHTSFFVSSGLIGSCLYVFFAHLILEGNDTWTLITESIWQATLYFFVIISVTYTRALFSNQPQLTEYVWQLPSYAFVGFGVLLLLNNNLLFMMSTKDANTLFFGFFMSVGMFDAIIYACRALKWLYARFELT
jgi:L-asparagine transporter-like permease